MKSEVIEERGVMKLNQLAEYYKRAQERSGKEVTGCRSDNLRAQLEKYFGSELEFWSPPGKPVFI